jgi:hypothetical protein
MIIPMSKFTDSAGKAIAVIAMSGAMSACAPRQPRVAVDKDCIEGPIGSAEEAERRSICYLRSVSEACVGGAFRSEVTRGEDRWQIRSIAPEASCSTWVVVLSAKDGQLIRFESEP